MSIRGSYCSFAGVLDRLATHGNNLRRAQASARNPGGGFLRGSNAQEESLARASALYSCLTSDACLGFYDENSRAGHPLYTDNIIMSTDVAVFRSEDGCLLDAPYSIGVVTAPAPNLRELDTRTRQAREAELRHARQRRMARVLAIAAAGAGGQPYDALVLGAWGCGVFRNDPIQVANELKALLAKEEGYGFKQVVLAVLDQPTCATFAAVFGARGNTTNLKGWKPAAAPKQSARSKGRQERKEGGGSRRKNASRDKHRVGRLQ